LSHRIFGIARAAGLGALLLGLLGVTGPAAAQSGFTKTRYPIVLAEGLGGIDFFQVAEALRAGGATVFLTTVDPGNSSTVRGQELLDQIEDVLAMTGASKVNLIGHSQGGLDARYILGTKPQVLASVTTVGTPHQGTPVADVALGLQLVSPLFVNEITLALANLITEFTSGGQRAGNTEAALVQLSSAGSAAYNRRFPAGLPTRRCGAGPASANGVALYSWGGASVATNAADISDGLLALTSLSFLGADNDGLVGRCSNHFGTVLKDDFRMNHLDEINQLNGLVGRDDPVAQYRAQANRLLNQGL